MYISVREPTQDDGFNHMSPADSGRTTRVTAAIIIIKLPN
jgi:hypothetical protein